MTFRSEREFGRHRTFSARAIFGLIERDLWLGIYFVHELERAGETQHHVGLSVIFARAAYEAALFLRLNFILQRLDVCFYPLHRCL